MNLRDFKEPTHKKTPHVVVRYTTISSQNCEQPALASKTKKSTSWRPSNLPIKLKCWQPSMQHLQQYQTNPPPGNWYESFNIWWHVLNRIKTTSTALIYSMCAFRSSHIIITMIPTSHISTTLQIQAPHLSSLPETMRQIIATSEQDGNTATSVSKMQYQWARHLWTAFSYKAEFTLKR